MINDQEKIQIIINRLDNLQGSIVSLIENAEVCKDKYILENEITICNTKKNALLQELQDLGGTWPKGLD